MKICTATNIFFKCISKYIITHGWFLNDWHYGGFILFKKFQITQKKLQWNAKSKIGSLENATHKPGGGDKKIESIKLDFKDKAKPKVASTVNITHKPGGGDVKVYFSSVQPNFT